RRDDRGCAREDDLSRSDRIHLHAVGRGCRPAHEAYPRIYFDLYRRSAPAEGTRPLLRKARLQPLDSSGQAMSQALTIGVTGGDGWLGPAVAVVPAVFSRSVSMGDVS